MAAIAAAAMTLDGFRQETRFRRGSAPVDFSPSTPRGRQIVCAGCKHGFGTLRRITPKGPSARYAHAGCKVPV